MSSLSPSPLNPPIFRIRLNIADEGFKNKDMSAMVPLSFLKISTPRPEALQFLRLAIVCEEKNFIQPYVDIKKSEPPFLTLLCSL